VSQEFAVPQDSMSLDDVGQLLREFGHTSSAQTLGAVNMVDHYPPKVLTDFDRL
jgi:hypothetical protein